MEKIDRIQKQGDALFENRSNLMALWQEIAENFYPERADFTAMRTIGEDYCSHLETSYPVLARRDLGNQIGGMLRPTNKEWFSLVKRYDENLDNEAKKWLEWATKIQKRAMFDPLAMFTRATKEGDHDWSAFGQCVISCRMNYAANALLHRCWHLRDVAWSEDDIGKVGTVFRKWKPDVLTLSRIFKDKVHRKVTEDITKDPYKEVNCYHCEVPVETYDGNWGDKKLVSIYYDCDNKHIMEEVGVYEGEYVIPRWQTVSGSQYAFSPATIAALPDARLIQAIARVLLDASEKIVNPPMVAVEEVVRSDFSIYPGGMTWISSDYQGKLEQAISQFKQETNMPVGFEMNADTRNMIAEAFYLNKLALPPPVPNMTAYEASERVGEYMRQALPLFEPMEAEYNLAICEKDFSLLLRNGAFGPLNSIPETLYGGDITFKFESPLREAVERQKGQRFVETKEMVAAAMELEPTAGYVINPVEALRDVLDGIGSPAKWRRSEAEFRQIVDQQNEMREDALALQQAQQGADVAKTVSEVAVNG